MKRGVHWLAALWIVAFWSVGMRAGFAQEPPKARPEGVAVVFSGETLFRVYSPLGTYRPEERALVIAERIQRLISDRTFEPSQLRIEADGDRLHIRAGADTIASVTTEDAKAAGQPQRTLAEEARSAIARVVARERHARTPGQIGLDLLFTAALFGLLVALLRVLGRIVLALRRRIEAQRGRKRTVTKASDLDEYVASHFADPLLQILSFLHVALALALYLGCAILVLSLFPWTREAALTIERSIGSHLAIFGEALLRYLPNLLFIGFIAFLAYAAIKVAHLIFTGIERGAIHLGGIERDLALPTFRFIRILILLLAAAAVFPYIPGSQSPAFQGVSVFIGALLTLGSTSVVSNLIAGVMLTFVRPFRVGDRVKIGDTIGDVISKSDFVTRIRTIKNEDITIPNSLILGAHIINYSANARTQGLILHTSLTIGYDAPWRQIHDLLLAAARETEGVLATPAPFVLQTALNDFYVTYELNAHTDRPNQMIVIYSALHQNIQDRFFEAGVEIMSPHYTSLRDGNDVAIPPEQRPPDYQPGAFRVQRTPASEAESGAPRTGNCAPERE